MIQNFEDEYPECRLTKASPAQAPSDSPSNLSRSSSPSLDTSTDLTTPNTAPLASTSDDDDNTTTNAIQPSSTSSSSPTAQFARHNSDVSLASRALGQEEGEIHRLGQRVRRDILRPETLDYAHSPTAPEPEAEHLAALRAKLEALGGGEIRDKVAREGWEAVMHEIGANAEELKRLRESNPEDWKMFRDAQIAAQRNAGVSRQVDEEGAGEANTESKTGE